MDFTPEQEQSLLERNMTKIYRAVDNFSARHSTDVARVPYDDFVQEVAIAFLKYIRKCKTKEEVDKFPWYSAMGAMRKLVFVYQPLSCEKSTHKFSEIMHSMPSTIPMDVISASTGIDVDGMSKHWVDDKETQMDFDMFMADQPENMRRIAAMRVYGMTMREIANQCGVSHVTVQKKIQRLCDAYREYSGGANNAE